MNHINLFGLDVTIFIDVGLDCWWNVGYLFALHWYIVLGLVYV